MEFWPIVVTLKRQIYKDWKHNTPMNGNIESEIGKQSINGVKLAISPFYGYVETHKAPCNTPNHACSGGCTGTCF